MRSFWMWFMLLVVSWLLAFIPDLSSLTLEQLPWKLVSSALFFTAFFIAPLFRERQRLLFITLLISAMFAVITLWPTKYDSFNAYTLMVYSILAGKAMYRLTPLYAVIVGFILFSALIVPILHGYSGYPILFIVLYSTILAIGLTLYRNMLNRYEAASARNESLLSEYRGIKRRLILDEQHARQEERVQVGRDIHDSVGHKLTALLMQLEIYRMQADEDTSNMLQGLKGLARESLEETRDAVKSLKKTEIGGLSAIIGLLRRLESESVMRVNLIARHGALTAPLNNVQSAAVYRAVQEATTNAMKHGNAREVHILFEAPGGGVFRFEVMNTYMKRQLSYREGYGLESMRERIEQAGGVLEVHEFDSQFIVRGMFPRLK